MLDRAKKVAVAPETPELLAELSTFVLKLCWGKRPIEVKVWLFNLGFRGVI
jgi:hypothetical protein